ncbi:MAG: V-type ATPase subunit [Nitrospirota bacterium]|nr:V-type ATPase subunit [Nitrospirota bacterium]
MADRPAIAGDRQHGGFRGLLTDRVRSGYPAEYLLTRLRGRRAKLVSNWKTLVYAPDLSGGLSALRYQGFVRERTVEGMWRSLLLEHQWVFRQMDERLRAVFAPYFVHAELRTLFISLRSLAGENDRKVPEVLSHSLLSGRVKAALNAEDAAAALHRTETILCGISPRFAGIAALYEREGARAGEQELTTRLFAAILEAPLHPVIRQFFERLVDARNVLSLYALLRAGRDEPAVFMRGGAISLDRLRGILEKGDIFSVLPVVKQASGVVIRDPEAVQVEVALYRGVTRFAKAEGRDPLGAGLILDYLWRCSLEVTNLGLLYAGKDLDREMILAELVH